VTDTFAQKSRPKVDVLWCVDVSQSMAWRQAELQENLAGFAGYLEALSLDYHLAVVTSDFAAPRTCPGGDPSLPGILFRKAGRAKVAANRPPDPAPPAFLPAGGDPDETFEADASPGVCGPDGAEGCLEAFRLALGAPNVDDENANGGFLRPDARLAVVALGGGDDHSPGSTDYHAAFLRGLVDQRRTVGVTFSVIAPFSGDGDPEFPPAAQACAGEGGSEPATRYRSVFMKVGGGRALSICLNDWGARMRPAPLETFVAVIEYYLSRQPDPSTIAVTVNGATVPEGPVNGWSYDAYVNSIVFGAGAVPPEGATIEVTYRAQCF
jgi:hypothetical protein